MAAKLIQNTRKLIRSQIRSKNKCDSPVFPLSPAPERRQVHLICKDSKLVVNDPDSEDLYPNCDATVWLRSCEEEIIIPIEGEIKGEIPIWLKGCLLRNGPGSLKVGEMAFEHLFDSSALLHRFAIKDGKVTYQCQFLRTDVFKKNHEAKRIVVTEFGTKKVPDPCHTIFTRVSTLFNREDTSDNAMISVYPFCDEFYAFTECSVIHRFDPDTLETLNKEDLFNHVGIVNHTSHPHVLPDGTVFNLGMSVQSTGPVHNIICFPPKKKSDSRSMFEKAFVAAKLPAKWPLYPSYMHTFGITENYFIIVEQPLTISIPTMVKSKITNEPMANNLKWFKNRQTHIQLINRHTGKLFRTYYSEAFFYLHIINQYELFNHVIIDICCYRDPSMLDCMYVETMKNMQKMPDYAKMFRGRPLRFVLPLYDTSDVPVNKINENNNNDELNLVNLPNTKAKAFKLSNGNIFVKPELLCDLGCETPRINYDKYLGVQYRYFYAISSDVDAENPGTIIKVDTKTKTAKTWCEPNCYPSEPIFVQTPGGIDEDDGIVLSSMVWGGKDTNRCGLVILDAKNFIEISRAEFTTPGPVPKCLHGWFTDKHGEFKDKKSKDINLNQILLK